MKNKKAGDRLGWKAKWPNNGGQEMIKRLTAIYDKLSEDIRYQNSGDKKKSVQKTGNKQIQNKWKSKIFISE